LFINGSETIREKVEKGSAILLNLPHPHVMKYSPLRQTVCDRDHTLRVLEINLSQSTQRLRKSDARENRNANNYEKGGNT